MKTNYPKKQAMLLMMMFFSVALFSQNRNSYWKKASAETLATEEKVHRASHPREFKVFKLDLEEFKKSIEGAPLRGEFSGKSNVIASFPTPEGTFEQFRITESPIMEAGLAAKFPNIKTYKAVGIDDPTATMRFSITVFGLHTMTLSGMRNSMYVDPYTEDRQYYMVYDKNSLGADTQSFECLTDEGVRLKSLENEVSSHRVDSDDQKLRTYRLAQTCTQEYGSIFEGGAATDAVKKARIQAQMAITVNRVNEIYERDLAVTLVFIARNDELIYYDNPDPWAGEFNAKTQEVISTTLNDESLYDIGHNFNTSGGGNAGCLGCVCRDAEAPFERTGFKGSGMTGRSDPTGDPFDIDYVAHEMGHQFDGYHTQASSGCVSGNGTTEVEPGSGSSIMGYAGICAANVQANSDAHFNYVNIRDITTNIQSGTSSSCAQEMVLTNAPPVAITEGAEFSIPRSTPFVLRGDSTDPDGTTEHTFGWSQNDPEPGGMGTSAPSPTATSGPVYRSILPTASPDRYMPSISDVVAGNLTPTFEVTPSVARELNFALVVRDNASGFANGIGQTDSELMKVNVENVTPFTMSAPNTGVTWNVGTEQMVTWNVGQTNNATINCQTINIRLSTDGGYTYPILLACNTPNDGSEPIVIPNNVSGTARIMVEAADNIFYDISDTNFTIANPAPTYVLQRADLCIENQVCQNGSIDIDLDFSTVAGFSSSTTFSASSLPGSVGASFSSNPLSVNGITTMTLNNFAGVASGTYTISVTGSSTPVTQSISVDVRVLGSSINAIGLTSPTDAQSGVVISPTLTWNNDVSATSYDIDIATDAAFTSIVQSATVASNSYMVNPALNQLTPYYWRVRGTSSCVTGPYSSTYSFTTDTCSLCTGEATSDYATSVTRVNIGSIDNTTSLTDTDNITAVGYNDFRIAPTATQITDVNRGSSYPLTVQINSDGAYTIASKVWIDWNHNCQFDLPSEEYDLGSANDVVNGATDASPYSITVPSGAATGNTTMRVVARYTGAGGGTPIACGVNTDGEVEDYTLNVLVALAVEENQFDVFGVYPNPSNGEVTISLSTSNDVNVSLFDVRGRQVYDQLHSNTSDSFNERVDFSAMSTGVYMLEVQSGSKRAIKKLVIQ